jgi:hypothetical protein
VPGYTIYWKGSCCRIQATFSSYHSLSLSRTSHYKQVRRVVVLDKTNNIMACIIPSYLRHLPASIHITIPFELSINTSGQTSLQFWLIRWNALQIKPARQTCRPQRLMNVMFVVALLNPAGEAGSLSTSCDTKTSRTTIRAAERDHP